MKIQLDTENKTIKIENNVELSKLVETLEGLLPNGAWKEFTLQTNTVISRWNDPIVIERYRDPYPWYQRPLVTWDTTTDLRYDSITLCNGTYNIEA